MMTADETRRDPSEKNVHANGTYDFNEAIGAIQVGADEGARDLKTLKDGKTKLIPQPSDDPNDPLNWSWAKKHIVFVSLFFPALLADFGMTYGELKFR